MSERIITTDACVLEGAEWLSERHPELAKGFAAAQPLPLRLKPAGFAQLLNAIVGQQVSVASANAIWGKLVDAGLTEETNVLALTEEELRAVGLSRQKARYARALAEAQIDYAALESLSSAEVIRVLTQVSGIGTWTAEIYAMFSLGRADVFAHGDLALQEAARELYGLAERPKEKEMRQMAEAWAPWRSVAARILWAYYKRMKNREGIR